MRSNTISYSNFPVRRFRIIQDSTQAKLNQQCLWHIKLNDILNGLENEIVSCSKEPANKINEANFKRFKSINVKTNFFLKLLGN